MTLPSSLSRASAAARFLRRRAAAVPRACAAGALARATSTTSGAPRPPGSSWSG